MAEVISRSGKEVTVAVTIDLSGSLLEMEEAIQEATNAVEREKGSKPLAEKGSKPLAEKGSKPLGGAAAAESSRSTILEPG